MDKDQTNDAQQTMRFGAKGFTLAYKCCMPSENECHCSTGSQRADNAPENVEGAVALRVPSISTVLNQGMYACMIE